MTDTAERATTAAAYAIIQAGAEARRTGAVCPYREHSMRSMLHCAGWLQEDLRLALMKARPSYAGSQHQLGKGLDAVGAEISGTRVTWRGVPLSAMTRAELLVVIDTLAADLGELGHSNGVQRMAQRDLVRT